MKQTVFEEFEWLYKDGIMPMNIHSWVEYLKIINGKTTEQALDFLTGERGMSQEYKSKPKFGEYKGPYLLVYGDSYAGGEGWGLWYMTSTYLEPWNWYKTEAEAKEDMDKQFRKWHAGMRW